MTSAVVLTGLVRDLPDLFATLDRVMALRADGLVDQIVMSTWFGELDRHEGLAAKLSRAGVDVVESETPSMAIRPKSMWNAWVQATSLTRGLDAVAGAPPVLKLRTDKTAPLVDLFRPELEHGLRPVADVAPFKDVFTSRVAVRLVRVAVPLHVADLAYFASLDDMRRIAEIDGALEADGQPKSIGVENRWLLKSFRDASRRLRDYTSIAHVFHVGSALQSWGADRRAPHPPPALWDLIALNARALATCLHSIDRRDGHEAAFAVEDLFDPGSNKGAWSSPTSRGVTRNFLSQDVIDRFSQGDVEPSAAAERFMAALARSESQSAAAISEAEARALREFVVGRGGAPEDVGRTVAVSRSKKDRQTEVFAVAEAYDARFDAFGTPDSERRRVRSMIEKHPHWDQGAVCDAVGRAYQRGVNGFQKSASQARLWFEQGARLRHANCQLSLARMILTEDPPPDDGAKAEALRHARDAAGRSPAAAEWLERYLGDA